MKLLFLSVTLACQLFLFASLSTCQETKALPDRLHFSMPFPEGHKVIFDLSASSAQRVPSSSQTGSILQLRGSVEVRMTTCRPAGNICDRSPIVLRADGVDYNERTGEIETLGEAHIVLIEPIANTVPSK